MTQSVFILLCGLAIYISGISYARVVNRPGYIECQSNMDCMPGNCCTIGAYRFSLPQCKPMQENGGVCRPRGRVTLNTTLVYPDGLQIELTDVHSIFCPCGYGLTCDSEDGICRDPSQQRGFNNLLGEASIEDD